MSAFRQWGLHYARKAGVLAPFEWLRYRLCLWRTKAINDAFLHANPDFIAPPVWWMHDMYSHTDIKSYFDTGVEAAAEIGKMMQKHIGSGSAIVADWGCGLGRVLRHLDTKHQRAGYDVNQEAIAWCQTHIEGVEFQNHGPMPPLPCDDETFDFLYAISVLTHLSKARSKAWIDEIERVLKPGGVAFLTVHGAQQTGSLLSAENDQFARGEPVYRDAVQEGSRIYVAYHPPSYLREVMFRNLDIVEAEFPAFGQEGWILRKPLKRVINT